MPVIVMLEIEAGSPDLWPAEFFESLGSPSCARVSETLCLAAIDRRAADIRERLTTYTKRSAVGAAEIWAQFPEYKSEYYVKIERMTPYGPASREVRLGDVVNGDRLTEMALTLYDQRSFGDPPPNPKARETIRVSKADLGTFVFLLETGISPAAALSQIESIKGKELYFCRIFSIVGLPDPEIVPGVRFLTMREFLATDCLQLIAAHNAQHAANVEQFRSKGITIPSLQITLPQDASGVFLADLSCMSKSYADALVSRLLAAVALTSGVSGQITLQMNIDDDRFSSHVRSEHWSRPYQNRAGFWQNVAWADNPVLQTLISLIARSTEGKFIAGKEDYRLLAIDTVEDSRRPGIAVLQLAQLWMAIERLLSFKNETTIQLALALSALSPATDRVKAFEVIRKSYNLRSQIVHGYAFKRDETINAEIQQHAQTFREVLALALDPMMTNGDSLRTAMVAHVLSGAASPMTVTLPPP
ncbi:hypothetical protein LL253_09165 [Sphingobium soli]|uniref:Apea-like HEPN domain-containing protein n=1 Tax=Sphingobium soli TaxID=1591116 RepID=A0ABS8H2U8_9SPHN|nr:HEPN domain-containing protein [Sphingobium soli]MCC4232860.1 hypothetical protein [Sphingobium soli]